jgi:hypothetical protein
MIDFATGAVERTWAIPDGGSPDMGNVTVDGETLWLSGWCDYEVYAVDISTSAARGGRVREGT